MWLAGVDVSRSGSDSVVVDGAKAGFEIAREVVGARPLPGELTCTDEGRSTTTLNGVVNSGSRGDNNEFKFGEFKLVELELGAEMSWVGGANPPLSGRDSPSASSLGDRPG